MSYIKGYMLFLEGLDNYKKTSWTKKIDGKDVTITIDQVEKHLKDEEAIDIPNSKLKALRVPTDPDRVKKAKLDYPIIVAKSGKKFTMLLDGNHRVQKAIGSKRKKIKAKVLQLDDAPKNYKEMFV